MNWQQIKLNYPAFYSTFFVHLQQKGLAENDIESLQPDFYYKFFASHGWPIQVYWYKSGTYVGEINGMIHFFHLSNKREAEEQTFELTAKYMNDGNG